MKKILILAVATLTLSPTLFPYVLNNVSMNGARWRSFPVTLNINPMNSGLPTKDVEATFNTEMEQWNTALGFTALQLGRANDVPSSEIMTVDGNNQIGFSLNFQSDSGGFDPQSAVAVSGQYGDGYAMSDAFMVFNSQYVAWYTDDATSTSKNAYTDHLPTIVLHELGHVLGLGHSLDTTAIMCAVRYQKVETTLTADDIAGAKYVTSVDASSSAAGQTGSGSSDNNGSQSSASGGCATITDVNGNGGNGGNISGNAALMLLPMIALFLMRKRIAVSAN